MQRLKTQLDNTQEIISKEILFDKEKSENEIRNLNTKINSIQDENVKLHTKILEIEKEHDDIISQYKSKLNNEYIEKELKPIIPHIEEDKKIEDNTVPNIENEKSLEIINLSKTISTLENENMISLKEINNLNSQIDNLKTELKQNEEMEKQKKIDLLSKSQSEINSLIMEIKSLKEDITQKDNIIDKLEKKNAQLETSTTTEINLTNQVNILLQEKEKLIEEINQIKLTTNKTPEQLEKIAIKLNEKARELRILSIGNAKIIENIVIFRKQIDSLSKELTELKKL